MPKSVLGMYIYTYVQTAELRSDEVVAGQETYLAEWSTSLCDCNHRYDSLDAIGGASTTS